MDNPPVPPAPAPDPAPAPRTSPGKMAIAVGVGVGALLVLGTLISALTQPVGSGATLAFIETFDGSPSAPTPLLPAGWDINLTGFNAHEVGSAAEVAQHGPACQAPPDRNPQDGTIMNGPTNTHPMSSRTDMVFQCNGHLMTATGITGYGAIYMIPPAMADFSTGPSTVTFDMSTLRTSSRDWVYVTLAPFDGHNKLAYNGNDQEIPPNNVNIKLAGSDVFEAFQRVNGGGDQKLSGNVTDWDTVQIDNGQQPSASRRDGFLIEISSTHIKVCLTGNNTGQIYTYPHTKPATASASPGVGGQFCWVNTNLATPLDPAIWHGQAVVMFSHVGYNAEKDCEGAIPAGMAPEDSFSIVHNPYGDAHCPPNTWHWDNIGISPATSYTILTPTDRLVTFNSPNGANTVTFAQPAPANARLSYTGFGLNCASQQFSVDGGATWITAHPQDFATTCVLLPDGSGNGQHQEIAGEFFTPIPAGTTSIKFRGANGYAGWGVEDVAIWSSGAPNPTPSPTVTPTPSPTASPTATPSPTRSATPAPSGSGGAASASPTASVAPSPTPSPTVLCEAMVKQNGVTGWAPQPPTFCNGFHQ